MVRRHYSISTTFALLICLIPAYPTATPREIILTVNSLDHNNPIPYCSICITPDDTCVYTNSTGSVRLSLTSPHERNLRFSATGFRDTLFTLPEFNARTHDSMIVLLHSEHHIRQLPRLVVREQAVKRDNRNASLSRTTFTSHDIVTTAGAVGDISRYMGTLPSCVTNLGEGYDNTLFVRGDRPTEVMFVVDGIEFENINHFSKANGSGGPIGFLNSDYIRSVDFFTGTMPAEYPSRLSSVVDITMKSGSKDGPSRIAGIKMTGGQLCSEGPLFNFGTYTVSGRYVDFTLLRTYIENKGIPKLGDLFGKIQLHSSETTDWYLTGIVSHNRYHYGYHFTDRSEYNERFENSLTEKERILQGGAGLSCTFHQKNISHEAHLSSSFRNGSRLDSLSHYSDSFFTKRYAANPIAVDMDNRIRYVLRTKSEITLNRAHSLVGGFRLNRNTSSFHTEDNLQNQDSGIVCRNGEPVEIKWIRKPKKSILRLDGVEASSFGRYRFDSDQVSVGAAVRADWFSLLDDYAISPRLSLSLRSDEGGLFSLSYGLYHQFPTAVPSRMFSWLATTYSNASDALHALETSLLKQVQPLRNRQVAAGWEKVFNRYLAFDTEVYGKWYDREYHFITPLYQEMLYTDENGSVQMRKQDGKRLSYGAELLLKKPESGDFFYSLGLSLFTVKNRYNDGTWHNDWTSVTYTWALSIGKRLLKKHQVTISAQGSGGRPYCPQLIWYDCIGRTFPYYDETQPWYSSRLDDLCTTNLRYSFKHTIGRGYIELFCELLNIFNYTPVLEYKFNGISFEAVRPFGFTPIVGCTYRL